MRFGDMRLLKKNNGKLINLKDVQLWFKNADSVI